MPIDTKDFLVYQRTWRLRQGIVDHNHMYDMYGVRHALQLDNGNLVKEVKDQTGNIYDQDTFRRLRHTDRLYTINDIDNEIRKLITAGNAVSLCQLLKAPFIYTRRVDSSDFVRSKDCEVTAEIRQTHEVRPMVEALFFEYHNSFCKLVDLLVASMNEALCQAFLQSLKNTDIPAETLCTFNPESRRKLNDQLQLLKNRGIALSKNSVLKGTTIVRHANELKKHDLLGRVSTTSSVSSDSSGREMEAKEESATPGRHQLQILQYKLNFRKALHNHDETYGEHRGNKPYYIAICNILFGCTVIFPFCKKILKGTFFFSDKTATAEIVSDADREIGLNPAGQEINDHRVRFNM